MDVPLRRLCSTDYPDAGDLMAEQTPFGILDRRISRWLAGCRCEPDQVSACLEMITEKGIDKIIGDDPATFDVLWPRLETLGWTRAGLVVMSLLDEPTRQPNPSVTIETIRPDELAHAPSYRQLLEEIDAVAHWEMEVKTEWQRGGEILVAWLDGRPAGRTGWFVRNGIARFRTVFTQPWARGRGVASALIRHVQDHPTVRAQDALAIFSKPIEAGGAQGLYERLGFRRVGFRWQMRLPPT